MFYILMPSLKLRQELIEYLRNKNITAVFHYLPLHLSMMGQVFGADPEDNPITRDVSDRLLRLPFYYDLTKGDQARVVEAITSFDFDVT